MTAGYRRELDNVNGESVEVGTEAALYRTSKLLKESHLVREEGFEPPRACARQLLRLLRLPVPPFPPKYRIPRHTLPPIWATRRKQRQVCRYHCVPDIRGTAIADCVLPLSIANSKQVRSPAHRASPGTLLFGGLFGRAKINQEQSDTQTCFGHASAQESFRNRKRHAKLVRAIGRRRTSWMLPLPKKLTQTPSSSTIKSIPPATSIGVSLSIPLSRP